MNKRLLFAPLLALVAACSGNDEPVAEVSASACEAGAEPMLHVASPDWSEQVIYMLFLDRFDDGNPDNNDQGEGEYDPEKPTHFSGGDIQGVIDRIPYLKELGVTAVWISPPVENQWWSSLYDATGWHGYWATNFKEVDPHFGTLEDYKRLSHELHCNGMYLIQDIVANHTANWWTYDGNYDPDDTAANFRLLEPESTQPAPSQPPFDMIDRNNPEHAAAEIYHWTPSITDYADIEKRYTYQLGALADINTENPVVIDALKDSYNYWIEEVGVDGFRVDTVIYVPLEFWNTWAHDDDGIFPHAARLGKEDFIAFGETFLLSDPFDDAGEKEIVGFIETDGVEGLSSMLGFPLFQEINRVLGQGQPPRQLEYRLDKFMELYPDPYLTPNFVDNHDTPRFLATGHVAALKQALAVVFTVPGIPILYQGTEQAQPETRMAMFKGGHRNPEGSFNRDSAMYSYVQDLTALRAANPVLTRGTLDVIASESAAPGLLAYRRQHEGETVLVILNSADHGILVDGLDVGVAGGTVFETLFYEGVATDVVANAAGQIDMELPARGLLVLRPTSETQTVAASEAFGIAIDPLPDDRARSGDFELTGSIGRGGTALELMVNGNADRRMAFEADEDGRWRTNVPVRDLGESENYAQIFVPATGEFSERIVFVSDVTRADIDVSVDDDPDDAYGPTGSYLPPQHQDSKRQKEIESVRVRTAGRNLELTLTMAEVTDVWLPPNGFDNVVVTTFFDLPDREGVTVLPLLDADMPDERGWDLAHFASGWISYMYRSTGATRDLQGEKLGVSPQVSGNVEDRTITFLYEGAKLGVDDWAGARVYVTTWETSGEGVYVDFMPEPSEWFFSGGENGDPRVMDDTLVELPASGD